MCTLGNFPIFVVTFALGLLGFHSLAAFSHNDGTQVPLASSGPSAGHEARGSTVFGGSLFSAMHGSLLMCSILDGQSRKSSTIFVVTLELQSSQNEPGIHCVVSLLPLPCVSILHHGLHSVVPIRA